MSSNKHLGATPTCFPLNQPHKWPLVAGGSLVPQRDFPDTVLRRADPSNGDLHHVLGHRSLEPHGGDGEDVLGGDIWLVGK